jgi:hypothetical protein
MEVMLLLAIIPAIEDKLVHPIIDLPHVKLIVEMVLL